MAKNAELNTTEWTEQKNRLEFHKVFYKVLGTENVYNISCKRRENSDTNWLIINNALLSKKSHLYYITQLTNYDTIVTNMMSLDP